MAYLNSNTFSQNISINIASVEKYAKIQQMVSHVDVSICRDFQRLFNGFYRVRRNPVWQREYYGLFQKMKTETCVEFPDVLIQMYKRTGNLEASFSSKLVATLKPTSPIWDRFVLGNLGLRPPSTTSPTRIADTIDIYYEIENRIQELINSPQGKECLKMWDNLFPEYSWISAQKKMDFYLWRIRY